MDLHISIRYRFSFIKVDYFQEANTFIFLQIHVCLYTYVHIWYGVDLMICYWKLSLKQNEWPHFAKQTAVGWVNFNLLPSCIFILNMQEGTALTYFDFQDTSCKNDNDVTIKVIKDVIFLKNIWTCVIKSSLIWSG